MALSFKERKKILKSVNTLDLTPIKLYSDEQNEDKLVTVIIPKFKNKIVVKLVSPKLKSDHFKVKLDKFGSAVWLKINGKTKVDQIIKDLKQKFGDEIQEENERTTKFIFQLYEQGFISFKEIN
ncbi:MAG TPA: PqqD family protein [Ignavibacteriaceae bacterium]|jgi:Coenzyme PQQ synthesis protein D (PqqD)